MKKKLKKKQKTGIVLQGIDKLVNQTQKL